MTPSFNRQPSASGMIFSGCLDDPGAAFAEADRGVAVAMAVGAEDRLVAVFEKGAGFDGAEGQRAAAVHALLVETAPARLGRPRDRDGADQIAVQEIAAAAAAAVTIQGDTVEPKLLPRNGPSGADSHCWMSRADQSLPRPRPKMCSAAWPIAIGSPWRLPGPTQTASSNS